MRTIRFGVHLKGWRAVLAIVAAVCLISFGVSACRTGQLGVTNFDSITLSDDLAVGDDLTVAGDTTFSGAVVGTVSNDLNGANLVIDATGNTALRATQDNLPILTLGGTPTAAALTVKNSQGTAVAVIRGNGELSALNALVAATAAPLAGVASTAVAPAGSRFIASIANCSVAPPCRKSTL